MATYRVDSIHIALGVTGDAAIHLLVKEPAGEVTWAMLVDGGESGGEAKIRGTMRWIERSKKYTLQQGNSPLQFDAVVITHWDKDHWTGVMNLIKQTYEGQPQERKLPFFKYENGGMENPLTVLYCPEEGFLRKNTLRFEPKPSDAKPVSVDFHYGANTVMKSACLVRMEPKNPGANPPATILGTNLITGKDPNMSSLAGIQNPADLVSENGPDPGTPGIYIIGVSTRVFGPTPPNAFDEADEEGVRPDDRLYVVDENKAGTPTNKSSIACMIIWPATPLPRLSHYFAGDMHWQEEKSLAVWTGAQGDRTTVGKHVSSLKLSHHGAKSSTPTMMIYAFNPYNLIASVGERNGHPSWELLFYIQGWMASGDTAKAAYRPVLSTQFPYYLAKWTDPNHNPPEDWIPLPGGNSNQMSMKGLDNPDNPPAAAQYKADVKTIFGLAGASVPAHTGLVLSDPFLDWTTAKANDPSLNSKSWARTRIADSWSRLSPVPADIHAGNGVVRTSDNFKLVRAQRMISFFIIESVNSSDRDGGVIMGRTSVLAKSERLRPDPSLVPPTPPTAGNLTFPNSTALGNQPFLPLFNAPASNVVNGKRTSPSGKSRYGRVYKRRFLDQLHSAANSTAPTYNPANGTNPNENGGLLDDYQPASEQVGGKDERADTTDDGKHPPIMVPLPEPGLPGPPIPRDDQRQDLQSPFFFVCSSNLTGITPPSPPDYVKQLPSTHSLNNFLSTFHLKGIVLARSPDPNTTDQVSLHNQDEFLGWLRTALVPTGGQSPIPRSLNDPATLAFTAFTNPQIDNYFTDFSLAMPMLGTSLTYSSKATAGQLSLPSALFGPGSTVPAENSLILGLESPETFTNLTLNTILKPATDRGAKLELLSMLELVLSTHTFHIDTSTAVPTRNAIWFEPMSAYNTVVRTQYAADAELLAALNKWIRLSHFNINAFTLITKLGCSWIPTKETLTALNEWEILIHTSCTITDDDNTTIASPMVLFDFQSEQLTITLQFDGQAPDMGTLLAWVAKQVSGAAFDFQDWFAQATPQNFNPPIFRRLVLNVELDKNGGFPTALDSLSIDLEVGVLFGKTDGQQEDVVFLFTYDWSKESGSALQGTLWCPPPADPDVDRRLLPQYEPCMQFEPITVTADGPWAGSMDLKNLGPVGSSQGKIINIPNGIPSEVTMVVLAINSIGISFEAKLECTEPDPAGSFPTIFLSRIALNASYAFSNKTFTFGCDMGVTMFPQSGSTIMPIELTGSINYDSGVWSASATVETPSMQGAHLLDYFDKDVKTNATALIQHIQLLYLSLDYQYSKSAGSSFKFEGSMGIGLFELDIHFDHTSGTPWTFTATVGTFTGTVSTVQEILDSIIGDGTVNLPSCVAEIKVGDTSGVAKPLFKLTLQGLKTNRGVESGQDIISTLEVNIGVVSFTFLQYRNSSWNVSKNPSKRILRLNVQKLPDFDVPIVGTIPLSKTIEDICFMWIQDGSMTNVKGQGPGLTKSEVENLNQQAFVDAPLYYKTTKETYEDTDVVIEAGCHFVIVTKDGKGAANVVMDYLFLKPSSADKVPTPTTALRTHAEAKRRYGSDAVIRSDKVKNTVARRRTDVRLLQDQPDPNAGSSTQKTAFKVSIGPLAVSNVGIKFSNSVFSLCFDASIAVGPIAMTLQGFSIDFDFGHGHDLQQNFPKPGDGVGFSLQGFLIAFDRDPLTVGGGLIKQPTKNEDDTYWAGGVDIEFKAWSFLAAGAYGKLTDAKTQETYTTTFVFAQLHGPLVNLSYASINGITGGFGYNNSLKLPSIAEVPSFPFLAVPTPPQPSPTGNPTMDMLTMLLRGQWFASQNGSFWVAAGLTVTAFQMLQVTAVAAVQWDPEVKAGIYAVAIADVPSTAAPFKIAHVELGIAATIDFGKGIAAFEAQLAPSSYILDPSCHLSGGFALYYWFKGTSGQQAGNPGDWVFTLGGYHAAYKPPAQYPNPPRLQIQWALGPLSITGQAYFAITPIACMAGGSLHASLQIGVLNAWLDAFADFIMNYSPFSFQAAGGVSVGVRYTLDLVFVTLHISIEISARLTLMGPPFQGSVYVDFWVFGFTINFGTQQPPTSQKASLEDFYYLALQRDSPTAQGTPPVTPTPHKFTCVSGLIPSTPLSKAAATRKRAMRLNRVRTLEPRGGTPQDRKREDDGGSVAKNEIGAQEQAEREGDDSAPPDPPVWEVHAGTFTFSISSVFAISDVTVNTDDADPVHYSAPRPDTNQIYSRPMCLVATDKPLQSDLEVTIKAQSPSEKDELLNDKANPWVVRAIIEQMPRALWDAYDPNTDPTKGSKGLLNNPGNPTVPLMMGILLVPPEPRLSKDTIQVFDAVASLPQDVFDKPRLFPPWTNVTNSAWLPVLPTPPPPSNPALPWENVASAWKTPGLGPAVASTTADMWNKCMGWGAQSTTPPSKVSGTVPARLVAELEQLYVAAPMMGVVQS